MNLPGSGGYGARGRERPSARQLAEAERRNPRRDLVPVRQAMAMFSQTSAARAGANSSRQSRTTVSAADGAGAAAGACVRAGPPLPSGSSLSGVVSVSGSQWKGDLERRPAARRRLAGDRTVVRLDDGSGDRQAEAGAALLARPRHVDAVEAVEHLLGLLRRQPGTVVDHGDAGRRCAAKVTSSSSSSMAAVGGVCTRALTARLEIAWKMRPASPSTVSGER